MKIRNPHNSWEDGVTHLNVVTSSKFPHVRKLTDLAENEFYHPIHGRFMSMRGMFYYLTASKSSEKLRDKFGHDLYKGPVGKKIKKINRKVKFRECVNILLRDNLEFREAFLKTCSHNLPLVSYRYAGNTYAPNMYIIELIEIYNELKTKLEAGDAIY